MGALATPHVRHAEPVLGHPVAQRLAGHVDAVHLAELLPGQRRAEIALASPYCGERGLPLLHRQTAVTRSAAPAGHESAGPTGAISPVQPLDLPHAEPQKLGRFGLRQPLLVDFAHQRRALELLLAHSQDCCRHARARTANPTFLLGRNPTFSFCGYTPTAHNIQLGQPPPYERASVVAPPGSLSSLRISSESNCARPEAPTLMNADPS